MTPSTFPTFPTFLTFLTFGLVRAGWLRLVTTKMDGRAIHRWKINPLLFSGHQRQKGQKGPKGVPVMTLSTFPTFLTFLTQRLRFLHLEEFPGRASGAPRKPWPADHDHCR
jgi:hypothetical protein